MLGNYKLIFAVLIICIVWGTTYLNIRIAVESMPPWFVTGIRQTIASLLLLPLLIYKKQLKWIGFSNLKKQILLSTLMIIMANGLTTFGEQYVTSSLTSVLASTTPMMSFIGCLFLRLEKFNLKSLVGIILGFCGILMIFWNSLNDLFDPNYRLGISLIFLSILSWVIGILVTKHINQNQDSILLNLLYQFGFAGVVQLIFAFCFTSDYNFQNWTFRSFFSVMYLGVFGSVIAYYAFNYALKRMDATKVSMLNYVNTIIAVFLGWFILDEEITLKFLIATFLIIIGVFITNYKKEMFQRRAKNTETELN